MPDRKFFHQSISEKGKVNFNGFPIFQINWVHTYQSISDTGYTYLNEYPIYLLFNFNKQKSINSWRQSLKLIAQVYVCKYACVCVIKGVAAITYSTQKF